MLYAGIAFKPDSDRRVSNSWVDSDFVYSNRSGFEFTQQLVPKFTSGLNLSDLVQVNSGWIGCPIYRPCELPDGHHAPGEIYYDRICPLVSGRDS